MRRAALALLLAVTACGGEGPKGDATANAISPAEAASAPVAVTPTRQIGQVSGLSGSTSALAGTVSDFLVERTDFGTRVQLAADTLFDFDKATLTPAAETNLKRTADLVRSGGKEAVTITGYTDAKGEDAYNLALSQRRAEAVAAWLKAQSGLAERTYETIGKGEAEPIAPNATPDGSDDPAGRAKNRRVTIDIPK